MLCASCSSSSRGCSSEFALSLLLITDPDTNHSISFHSISFVISDMLFSPSVEECGNLVGDLCIQLTHMETSSFLSSLFFLSFLIHSQELCNIFFLHEWTLFWVRTWSKSAVTCEAREFKQSIQRSANGYSGPARMHSDNSSKPTSLLTETLLFACLYDHRFQT